MIKVLLADKQLLTRQGILAILSPLTNITVVGHDTEPNNILKLIHRFRPDVVMIAVGLVHLLLNTDFINFDDLVNANNFLILFSQHESKDVAGLMELGVQNFVSKEAGGDELLQAIYQTAIGNSFFCQYTNEILADKKDSTFPLLTNRETEIIRLVADGMTNNQIAEKLFLSYHTIKTHRKNIIKKLGFTFKNTAELSAFIQSQTV